MVLLRIRNPGSQTYADADPDPSHKMLYFYKKNLLKVKKHAYKGTKAFFKGKKIGVFLNFGQFPWSWIRIRIPNADPDPGAAKSMRTRANPDPQQ